MCVFVGKGLVCIFFCFCVSLDHFGFMLSVLLGLFFSVSSQDTGWEERLRKTYFVSSGTLNLAPSISVVSRQSDSAVTCRVPPFAAIATVKLFYGAGFKLNSNEFSALKLLVGR